MLRSRNVAIAVTLLLTAYQLVRIIAFINVYGGIEHDGGWMLSISRSLAETGTYTTMVSTISDPGSRGANGVDIKFDIQADDGRIWFFTGNGIGPASIVPDALMIWLFGSSFWALHLGPLLFFTGVLLLSARLLYAIAGLGAVVLFHAYLVFYPQLSVFLGYEAMGEVPAMFYILLAFLAFAHARRDPAARARYYAATGLLAGLAINAKLIALFSISGIFLVMAVDLLRPAFRPSPATRRQSATAFLALAAGTLAPLALWELVQLVVITTLAGVDNYGKHLAQRWWFVLNDGSGIGDTGRTGIDAMLGKFLRLSEIAHPEPWVTVCVFAALLIGGATLVWRYRRHGIQSSLTATLWLGWAVNTAWFVAISKTGWVRHDWFGLVLAVLVLAALAPALLTGNPITGEQRTRRAAALIPGALVLGVMLWGFASQRNVAGFFLPDSVVPYWQAKQIADRTGASLPWIIVPRAAQDEAAEYIRRLPLDSRVYYPGGHKTAELTPLTGRLHYPLARRSRAGPQAQDVLVLGPSIVSPWQSERDRNTKIRVARQDCYAPLIVNDYYWLCALPVPAPAVARYTHAETMFQNGLRLLGYDAPSTTPRAGDGFVITLFWQTDRPVSQSYTAFVHLLGTQWNARNNNPLWGQSDQQPAGGMAKTVGWQPGAIIADAHVFRIAPDAPRGTYQLEVGMYAPESGARLMTLDGADRAIILDIEVQP
ncbi:MAG: hypothetical protein HZB53_11710 [Chloroflexi bacterium]|nr:hypothetical protein [Chloroflexota bacterium]